MIYLDNAATTFPKPEAVYQSMDYINRNLALNAGRGAYNAAKKVSEIIDDTRNALKKLVNADSNAISVFTPSVTIALNQILMGLDLKNGDIVYASPYEHNAVARTLHLLVKEKGIIVKELPINQETLEIDIDKMKYVLAKDKPKCVCSTYVSNVTGYILPIDEIFTEARKNNAVTVLDAAQAVGLIEMDLQKLKVDFMAFAGHKTLYGPFGIAGFIINSNTNLKEVIVGGTGSDSLNLEMPQYIPNKFEPASTNIVAISGLKAALEWIDVESIYTHEKELTSYLVSKLTDIDGVKLYLPKNLDKHISIVSFNIDGYKSEEIGMILDEDFDIAVRTGYHCAPFIHKYLKDEEYFGTVRVSLGKFNEIKEIDTLINAIEEI